MISKAQVKHIQSLADKKNRVAHGQFVVEGDKMVEELLLAGWEIELLCAMPSWLAQHKDLSNSLTVCSIESFELERISFLKSPQQVLAIVKIPSVEYTVSTPAFLLDDIQDPGNLGAMIRIADWYGIKNIYCSAFCADAYSPKVVQASMGSIFRVNIHIKELEILLMDSNSMNSFAAVLEGDDINHFAKAPDAMILIGNESKGVKPKLSSLCKHKVAIKPKGQAESLNAAVAAGIICHSLLS